MAGREEEEGEGGGKREKLVHAMITVLNHKATICCKGKVNIAKKKKKKPSHQNTKAQMLLSSQFIQAFKSPWQLYIHLLEMAQVR